ncbi:hypothetical protein SLEP1_g31313 [Rubroshorea leprosula]|uniref:Uncharacterized protein n=1 Tax=Rubroshorea leprosula TaxID=152421 RepID=A0AAV5K305_9ROSI|nr:hypothetical protein SLEP1_g31313 [Rubroshorea leprosula]
MRMVILVDSFETGKKAVYFFIIMLLILSHMMLIVNYLPHCKFFSSFLGRRDYRDSDLRNKLDRRPSSEKRYSPKRDARGRRTFRGYSPSRSVEKKSGRSHRQKYLSGQSDFSENLKTPDEVEDRVNEGRNSSFHPRIALELKEVELDISRLDQHKLQLRVS